MISAAYLTYATLIATLLTSTMLAPQIFLFSKAFITSSIDSVSFINSVSNTCPYSEFGNTTSSKIPGGSRTINEEEMSRLIEAEDLVLGDENETDTSFFRDIHDSHYHKVSDSKWKNRMSVNSRIDLRLLSPSEVKHDKELCRQEWNETPGSWNEEVFSNYLKHFLELNSKSGDRTKSTGNGFKYPRSPMKTCSQYLNINNLGLPLGSIIRV